MKWILGAGEKMCCQLFIFTPCASRYLASDTFADMWTRPTRINPCAPAPLVRHRAVTPINSVRLYGKVQFYASKWEDTVQRSHQIWKRICAQRSHGNWYYKVVCDDFISFYWSLFDVFSILACCVERCSPFDIASKAINRLIWLRLCEHIRGKTRLINETNFTKCSFCIRKHKYRRSQRIRLVVMRNRRQPPHIRPHPTHTFVHRFNSWIVVLQSDDGATEWQHAKCQFEIFPRKLRKKIF